MVGMVAKQHIENTMSTINKIDTVCNKCIKQIDDVAQSQMKLVTDGYITKQKAMPVMSRAAELKIQLKNQKIMSETVKMQIDTMQRAGISDAEIIYNLGNMNKALKNCYSAILQIKTSIGGIEE